MLLLSSICYRSIVSVLKFIIFLSSDMSCGIWDNLVENTRMVVMVITKVWTIGGESDEVESYLTRSLTLKVFGISTDLLRGLSVLSRGLPRGHSVIAGGSVGG